MATNWPTKGGVNLVGEYQVSGHSFVVANGTSARTINLNYLSSEITVIANADSATLTFSDGKDTPNTRTITLPKGSHTFKIKCKKIVTNSTSMSLVISCTNILATEYTAPDFELLGSIS